MEPLRLQLRKNDCGSAVGEDEIFLQHAIEKLVRFGERVGVTPDQMIGLLESGISVVDLLVFLDWKASRFPVA